MLIFEAGWKNLAVPHFFNPLLSVWISDETLFLVFDILNQTLLGLWSSSLPRSRFLDVMQRSPKRRKVFFGGKLHDIQKTAARETNGPPPGSVASCFIHEVFANIKRCNNHIKFCNFFFHSATFKRTWMVGGNTKWEDRPYSRKLCWTNDIAAHQTIRELGYFNCLFIMKFLFIRNLLSYDSCQ